MTHIIRLREPWELSRDGRRITLRRAFNRPTGLLVGDQVWLVIDGLARIERVLLNDAPLEIADPVGGATRSEICSLLKPRNVVTIEAQLNDDEASEEHLHNSVLKEGLVRLEINNLLQ